MVFSKPNWTKVVQILCRLLLEHQMYGNPLNTHNTESKYYSYLIVLLRTSF